MKGERRYSPLHLRERHGVEVLPWGEDAVSLYGGDTGVFALHALVPLHADLERPAKPSWPHNDDEGQVRLSFREPEEKQARR